MELAAKQQHAHALQHDQWGRPEVYVAEYKASVGGGMCIFATLDAAIFFVISGLGADVDWARFPSTTDRYPYEERSGSERQLTPLFRVERNSIYDPSKPINGSVTKVAAMDNWQVGNGVAERAAKDFVLATGRAGVIELSGTGDRLSAKVREPEHVGHGL